MTPETHKTLLQAQTFLKQMCAMYVAIPLESTDYRRGVVDLADSVYAWLEVMAEDAPRDPDDSEMGEAA